MAPLLAGRGRIAASNNTWDGVQSGGFAACIAKPARSLGRAMATQKDAFPANASRNRRRPGDATDGSTSPSPPLRRGRDQLGGERRCSDTSGAGGYAMRHGASDASIQMPGVRPICLGGDAATSASQARGRGGVGRGRGRGGVHGGVVSDQTVERDSYSPPRKHVNSVNSDPVLSPLASTRVGGESCFNSVDQTYRSDFSPCGSPGAVRKDRVDAKQWHARTVEERNAHGGGYKSVDKTPPEGVSASLSPQQRRLASSSVPAMAAAFTDRALRAREERGLLLDTNPQSSNRASSPNACKSGDCNCAVCRPFEMKVAGQSSTTLHRNRILDIVEGVAPLNDSPSAEKCLSPGRTVDAAGSRTRRCNLDCSFEPEESASVTRSKKAVAACRSNSSEPTWSSAAGWSTQERCQSIRTEVPHGVDDSPGKIVPGLTPTRKHDGCSRDRVSLNLGRKATSEFSKGFTEYTRRKAVAANSPVLRYDAETPTLRCKSSPPDLRRSRWNPVNHDGNIQEPRVEIGSAGISTFVVSEKNFKRWRGGSTRLQHASNISSNMESVTSNAAVRLAPEVRTRRLATDKNFASICAATEQTVLEQTEKAERIKSMYGNHHSHQVASNLQWDD
eukprot:TRINITY_DN68418_c0_g1_i1.p1 TRINITY_DN68418_c0_g1~~TRINITY_DN68418_c0_g1_i1.p1  ORF type:complete len:618 (+),score=70.24 TRINITY_DN68418_c0_g1_i1:92-1945(+)